MTTALAQAKNRRKHRSAKAPWWRFLGSCSCCISSTPSKDLHHAVSMLQRARHGMPGMLCHGIHGIGRSSSVRCMHFLSSCQGHNSGPRAQEGYVCHKNSLFWRSVSGPATTSALLIAKEACVRTAKNESKPSHGFVCDGKQHECSLMVPHGVIVRCCEDSYSALFRSCQRQ